MSLQRKALLQEENIFNDELYLDKCEAQTLSLLSLNLVDRDLLNEIKSLIERGSASLYFGKTLRDIKCVVQDENGLRFHPIFLKYKSPKKLTISSVDLPQSTLQDRVYKNIEEIITAYTSYVNDLSAYFFELERIDRCCSVMEPTNPSFKDDYRRILIDDRTWLHVTVTPKGLATNIHLVGYSELWQNKFQSGLLTWDHDKDIVENIMSVFNLSEFPVPSHRPLESECRSQNEKQLTEVPTCAICLCDELPDNVGVPQLLCQNPTCGVYFHRSCLYQWLMACSGNRAPAFGVATGACPTCLKQISCEKDF